jgi:trehalose/maltose transport system substrate-binding protein
MALVRFLSRGDVQVKRSRVLSVPPTLPGLYDRADVLAQNPYLAQLSGAFRTGMVSRPSNVTGKKYQQVTDAYIQAVHDVLTGRKKAPDAAAALESELVRITAFPTGPPPTHVDQHLAEWKPGSRR